MLQDPGSNSGLPSPIDHGIRTLAPELAIFIGVADWSSLTAAAAQVGVPQPTASRMLSRMQRELGVELVRRDGRGLTLTPSGIQFLPYARRCIQELRQGFADLNEQKTLTRGTVSLAFLHTLGARFVPELLEEFREDFPRVDFILMQDVREKCLDSLKGREAELAIVSPLPDEPIFISKVIETQELFLTVPVDHQLAGQESVDLSQVKNEDFVAFTPGIGLRSLGDSLCRQAGFTPRARYHVQDTVTARGIIAAGLGVAILPHSNQPVSVGKGCVEIRISGAQAERQLALSWLSGTRITEASMAFRIFVLDKYGVPWTDKTQ